MINKDFFSTKWNGQSIKILGVDDPAAGLYKNGYIVTDEWENQTGMKVKFDVTDWSDYAGKVFSMLDSGSDEYDAMMIPGIFWLPKFSSSHWIAKLDDLIKLLPEAWRAYDFEDIHYNLRSDLSYKGNLYLIPCFTEIQIVYYRKDLIPDFEIKGVNKPISVHQYAELASKINSQFGIIGTHIKGSLSESFPEWLPFLSSFGGVLYGNQDEPLFNSVAGVKSLEFMVSLLNYCGPDVGQSDNETIRKMLFEEKIGIINHWSGQLIPSMRKIDGNINDRYGFSFLENPWGTTWSFALNTKSKKNLPTLSYLLWATSQNNDVLQSDFSGSPVRQSTFNNKELNNKYPWFTGLVNAINRKNDFPSFYRFADDVGHLYVLVNEVLTKNVDIKEALQRAEILCKKTKSYV